LNSKSKETYGVGLIDIVENFGRKDADATAVGLPNGTEVGKQEADIVAVRDLEAIFDHVLSPEW
jgi:hypothetical protein